MAGDSSLGRALAILDALEEAGAPLPFEAMHARFGLTRSTLYRYLKALADAGLVTGLHDRGYVLGPRVAELDRAMRLRDPLIAAARPVMEELATELGGLALLCRRYRDRVLCVHRAGSLGDGVRSTYERGHAMPLFRGAASRVILAWLPAPMLSRLREGREGEFAAAGLGGSVAEARAHLRTIRRRGWDATRGQVTRGVTGIAAPLLDARGAVLGSLSVTLPRPEIPEAEVTTMAALIVTRTDGVMAAANLPQNPK